MAQIFVSHSSRDRELVDFLSRAFATTRVRGVFEEYEALRSGPANSQRILQHISASNAVFMLLGPHVESVRHTRDWVGFEGGAAAAAGLQARKDIWVLESQSDLERLSVVTPRLHHYVSLDAADSRWQDYLSQIISSYDDSRALAALAVGGLLGVAAVRRPEGVVFGLGAGLLITALTSPPRPPGFGLRCEVCHSSYQVHVGLARLRCPVCNARLLLPPPVH